MVIFRLFVGVLMGILTVQANSKLPENVFLKSPTQTLARTYFFAVQDGKIWFKHAVVPGSDWQLFGKTGLPDDQSAGYISGIAADGSSIVAINRDGKVFDAEISEDAIPVKIKWNKGWGWPFRLAPKDLFLPKNSRGWSVSLLDLEDGTYYQDPAGNPHLILGIMTLYALSEDGRTIHFDDPWLPPNPFEFQFSSPEQGAVPAVSLSASGSTVFVMSKTGRMFTRLIDFDTLGGNPGIAYTYQAENFHWKPEGCWATWRTKLPFLLDSRVLPTEDWLEQPAIPASLGRHTKNVTILLTGKGNESRELRVEGISANNETGFFWKPIFGDEWAFKKIGASVTAELIDPNSAPEPALANGETHEGTARFYEAGDYLERYAYGARIEGFNLDFDVATVRLTIKESPLTLALNLEAGVFPFRDGKPTTISGTLIVPPTAKATKNPWAREILDDFLRHRSAYPVRVRLSKSTISIEGNRARSVNQNSFVLEFKR